MMSLSREYNQIVNLTKFNVNFSKFVSGNDLLSHDPSYILEKYNHWIGFDSKIDYKSYTPDNMTDFFLKYSSRWRDIVTVKNILMYLYSTQNMNLITMANKFEEYIGPLNMISDISSKRGLHHLAEKFTDDVLKKNDENIKVVLRDLKIGSLID